MEKAFKIGYFIFVAAALSMAVLVLASILPIPGRMEVKIVRSGSMEPAIKTGSLVFIRPAGSYKVGDIVTFGKDTKTEMPTTHRIAADRAEGGTVIYKTKGDANEDQDVREIRREEIIGKVLFAIPYLGYIMDFAKKPAGFILLVGLPALFIICDETAKIIKEVKKMRARKESSYAK